MKARIKPVVILWAVYLLILVATRVPSLQLSMISFAKSAAVPWLISSVNFIINGFWIFAIPLAISSFFATTQKHPYDTFVNYATGLDPVDRESGVEVFVSYPNVHLVYGKLQESFIIEAKKTEKRAVDSGKVSFECPWQGFSSSDLFRQNLERYGRWPQN